MVATGNPGCLIQLQYGAKRDGPPVTIKYVTDLLDEAYSAERSVGTKARPPRTPGDAESPWEEERYGLRTQWKSRPGDRRQRRDR